MPLRWQLHEAHNNGLTSLYRELGFLDSQCRLRQFNGVKFWPAWEAQGHTTGNFESRSCRLKEDGKRDPSGEKP